MRFEFLYLSVLAAVCLTVPAFAQRPGSGPDIAYEVFAETDAVHPGSTVRLVYRFELDERWHVNAHKPLDKFLIPTVLSFDDDEAPFTVERVVYPEHSLYTFDFSPDDPLAVYEATFFLGVEASIADDVPIGEDLALAGSLRYQACNDAQCAMPRTIDVDASLAVVSADQALTAQSEAMFAEVDWDAVEEGEREGEAVATAAVADAGDDPTPSVVTVGDWETTAGTFTVANRLDGFAATADFLAFVDDAESGAGSQSANSLAGLGIGLVLAAIFFGGILLNLTPCVLPLIPINIAIIGAGARAGSKTRGFALGASYGAGITVVYGLLGLVVVLGLASAFGTLNSAWWFNAGMAALFVVLGLAMFDLVHIDFSRFQSTLGIRKNENGSFLIATGMGAISALLAGACVAPVVIATIVTAQDWYTQGYTAALALPFLLGLGMALPWPFAGAGLSFLPKPGLWMNRVKYAFGVFILGFAAYTGWTAWTLLDERMVDPNTVEASVLEAAEGGWVTSLEEGLAEARAESKPVLIDFWATWCKSCKVMNETTLKEDEVLDRLDGYVKIKFQAEDFADPYVAAVTEYYGVLGLPTFLILQPEA